MPNPYRHGRRGPPQKRRKPKIPPDPKQMILLQDTRGTCHWCGKPYVCPADREDVGACHVHEQHTRDQLATADPDLPF